MKGFAPYIESHLRPHPQASLTMIERECTRAWYRMARSIEMNVAMKGLIACAWLHSPDTLKISPHLSFVNKPFIESGAIITTVGKADDTSGFLGRL